MDITENTVPAWAIIHESVQQINLQLCEYVLTFLDILIPKLLSR